MRPTFDVSDPVLARAAWSRIAEPGDEVAGLLVQHLGPVEALGWLIDAAADPVAARSSLSALFRAGGSTGTAAAEEAAAGRATSPPRQRGCSAPSRGGRRGCENLDPRRELRVLDRLGRRAARPRRPTVADVDGRPGSRGAPVPVGTGGARTWRRSPGGRSPWWAPAPAPTTAEHVALDMAAGSSTAAFTRRLGRRVRHRCGGAPRRDRRGRTDRRVPRRAAWTALYPAGNANLLRDDRGDRREHRQRGAAGTVCRAGCASCSATG